MPRRKRPVLGTDYIVDPDGKAEFTESFLIQRGYCCDNGCRYCPFINHPDKPDSPGDPRTKSRRDDHLVTQP